MESVESRLRSWHESRLRVLQRLARRCAEGPSLPLLYQHVFERPALANEAAAHVTGCPFCARRLELLGQLAVEGAGVGSAGMKDEERGGELLLDTKAVHHTAWPLTDYYLSRARLSSLLGRRWRRWALGIGGLAAACLLVILWLFPPGGSGSRVVASDLREFGFAPSPPLAGFWIDPADRRAILETEADIIHLRTERDQALVGLRVDLDPWIPWTQLYRRLRSLGKIDESLREMHAFRQYAEERDRGAERFSMYYSCLTDLGNTYQAIGDYEQALHYYQDALRTARDYVEWLHRTGRSKDTRPHAFKADLANTLTPCLWSLSVLSAARGDQKNAWDYHRKAGELLLKFFRLECRHCGLSMPADASLPALCKAVAESGATGLESHVVKVREHLMLEARLYRLDRDLPSAILSLENGRTLPDYPFADESRLDFNEPMEELRIAIARGDWPAALAAADEAQKHTGPRHFRVTGHLSHPPIGVLARAELKFLHGVALLGPDGQSAEGKRLVLQALQAIQKLADQMYAPERERFLKQFELWRGLASDTRGLPANQTLSLGPTEVRVISEHKPLFMEACS